MSAAAIENIWLNAIAAARLIDEQANREVNERAKVFFSFQRSAVTCTQAEAVFLHVRHIWKAAYDHKMKVFRNAWNEVALLKLLDQ